MKMAEVISQRSPDPDKQVGAIIVDANHVILGAGYNAMPRGIDQTGPWDDQKHLYVVHAEANAIYNARGSLRGAIIYTTLHPCNECAKAIIQTGIREVVFVESKDKDYIRAAQVLLRSAKVKIRRLTTPL